MASTSTRLPRTEACTDASVFHYLSNVASWMTTHTPGKSTWTLRIPPALATSSNLSNIPLTQLGLLTNSKSTSFCVGDQAEFVCIRGLIPLMIPSSPLSHTPDHFCRWRLSRRWRRRSARVGWGPNLHVALAVTDELLAHHWRAAFPKMMRIIPDRMRIYKFPIE